MGLDMPDPTHIPLAALREADRVYQAARSATPEPPVEPTDDEQAAADYAAYVAALESELALLEHLKNPRADQVRAELARARRRNIAAA